MLKFLGSFVLVILTSCPLLAQVQISAEDSVEIATIQKQWSEDSFQKGALQQHPISKINDIYYVSFLGKINENFDKGSLLSNQFIVGNPIQSIVSLKIPVQKLGDLYQLQGVQFLALASKINHQLDKAIHDIHADSVHMGLDLPQGYKGTNVYIGVTDWGFDYTHPVFYDSTLTQTRIAAAWDQYKTSGPHPNGFNYGTEYNGAAALLAAGSDTSNIYNYATHGTHVAGIAGGTGAGSVYRGVAYDAHFLFVTFLVDEAAVLDAWEWMYQKAQADGKRLVINMSWGLYHFGTLDGNSLLSQAITAYSNLGVVFVNSAGNNGNVNFHLKKTFANDLLKSKVDFYSYGANANMWGQSIHAWGEVGHSFQGGIIVANPGNTTLVESPFFNTSNTNAYIDTFLVTGADTIWYNLSANASHPLNGKPQMRLRVKCLNTSLKIILKATADSGTVHFWNVTELSNDVGNWGMPFSYAGSGTVGGDADNGISEPSCADDVISVAAYAPSYTTPGGSSAGGGLAGFSSHGPRYDGTMKPDISAPGVSICSAMSSFTDVAYTSVSNIVFNGTTYHFARLSGTSMSSPVVAGVCALMLEANPYLTAFQVKDILRNTARLDNFTGSIPAAGSPTWGKGKVNAYACVKEALNLVGEIEVNLPKSWNLYPNPVAEEIHFTLLEDLPTSCRIVNSKGQFFDLPIYDGKVSLKNIQAGEYILQIQLNGHLEQETFLKVN